MTRGTAALLAALGAAAACTVEREAPDLRGQDVRLTLLHTSDIHSRLIPYDLVPNRFDQILGLDPARAPFGGIARMATILRRERERSARVLHLDSGDCFQGAPIFNLFSGEVELRALSAMGLDAAALGNHEFDKGTRNLALQASQFARFPILAANYFFEPSRDAREPSLAKVIKPYQIFNVDGLKVGVIGMGNRSSLNSIAEGGNSLGIRPLDEPQVIRDYVSLLRPQVDLLVMLSHLGLDEDEDVAANEVERDENDALAIDGVDLILGGHLHIVLNPPKLLPIRDADGRPTGRTTLLVHSGAFAKFVGRLDVVVHVGDPAAADPAARRSELRGFTYKVVPIDSTVPIDADVARLVEPYELRLNRAIDLTRVFAFIPGEKVLRNDLSGGDSQLGNLVATSMRLRRRVEADFSLTNSLGIRADFEQGPLTIESMFNVFPFENSITTMFLSGGEVQEMLDFVSLRSSQRGCRTQAQVSGIWFKMICGAEPHAERVFLGDDCQACVAGDEVACAAKACAPLNEFGSYRVAVNDFIAAGGSGFEVLKRNTTKLNTGISLRDALVDFLQNLPACASLPPEAAQTVPEAFRGVACIDATLEGHDGRITPEVR